MNRVKKSITGSVLCFLMMVWCPIVFSNACADAGSPEKSSLASPFFIGLQAQGAWNYDGESSNFGYPLLEAGYNWGDFSIRGKLFPIIATMGAADIAYTFYRSGRAGLAATVSYAFRSMYDYWSDSIWTGIEVGWNTDNLSQYYITLSHAAVYHEKDSENGVDRDHDVFFKYLALGMGVRI